MAGPVLLLELPFFARLALLFPPLSAQTAGLRDSRDHQGVGQGVFNVNTGNTQVQSE